MTEEKIRIKLLIHIKEEYGSQKKAAEAWGIDPAIVSKMITGVKPIYDNVLEEIGYKKEVKKLITYTKK